MAKVCCATDSVEYPTTLRHAIPRFSRYALSRLFVPVAVTHTSFKWLAFPMVFSLTSTLFSTSTSASTLRTAASSAVEKSYFITSPNASYADKSISSPIDFASKKRFSFYLFLLQCCRNFIHFLLVQTVKFQRNQRTHPADNRCSAK